MLISYLAKILLLTLLSWSPVCAQNFDIVSSCTRYKESIFEKKVPYSFLLPGSPVSIKKEDNCHSYTPLIVNGLPAEPKEFPHMARLGHRTMKPPKTDWFCGGTLISPRYVLTAAHCLESVQGEVNVVRLGELDFDSSSDDAMPQDYAVADYMMHPNYTNPKLYNDIALIKLAEDVKFDLYKHPACLPFEDGSGIVSFIAIGWGSIGLAKKSSSKLLKVQLEQYPNERCRNIWATTEEFPQGFELVTQMCVGSNKAKDTCGGDSGGPILAYHKDYPCMYHVMGVTSVGLTCGRPNFPSIYTRVHHYLDWIRENISK